MEKHTGMCDAGGQALQLRGLPNTRDLGGIQTKDGRVIAMRRLLRSGALGTATAADLDVLVNEYHLKTIVDFRDTAEKMQNPDPVPVGVKHVQLPIFKEEQKGITREGLDTTVRVGDQEFDVLAGTTIGHEDIALPEDEATILEKEKAVIDDLLKYLWGMGPDPMGQLREGYRKMIRDPHSIKMYRAFMDTLLDQGDGALLYHCAAGKDRVGLGTLYILSALGVDEARIIQDYLFTNDCYQDQMDQLTKVADAAGYSADTQEAARTMMGVDESLIGAALEEIHKDYPDVTSYMKDQMALTDEDFAALQSMYLVEA